MQRKTHPALKASQKKTASFILPMECLPVPKLPDGPLWVYEVKLDGFRAIGVKTPQDKVNLLSRRGNLPNRKFPDVVQALATLPGGTIIDGEIVALDEPMIAAAVAEKQTLSEWISSTLNAAIKK
jgi:ATP-dependent DNA ligase